MQGNSDHASAVDAWIAGVAHGRRGGALVDACNDALDAVWRAGVARVGENVLAVVAARVGRDAAREVVDLGLRVEPRGISCAPERLPDDALIIAWARFVFVELLTVLGDLSAGVLSPTLHGVLAGLTSRPRSDDERSP